MSQLTLTSDPLGSATTGTWEFSNPAFYLTGATSQRGVVLADQYTIQTAGLTLANNTSAQSLFSSPSTVTVVAGTYEFECFFSLSGLSTSSSTFSFGLATAGATFTQYWWATGVKAAFPGAGAVTYYTGAQSTLPAGGIAVASTTATGAARVQGIIVVTVGGTVVPQIQQITASTAATVGPRYFKIRALGDSTAVSSGNWS